LDGFSVSYCFTIAIDFSFSFNRAGLRTVKLLNSRSDFPKYAGYYIVRSAGHQLMIDNPGNFHETIRLVLLDHQE